MTRSKEPGMCGRYQRKKKNKRLRMRDMIKSQPAAIREISFEKMWPSQPFRARPDSWLVEGNTEESRAKNSWDGFALLTTSLVNLRPPFCTPETQKCANCAKILVVFFGASANLKRFEAIFEQFEAFPRWFQTSCGVFTFLLVLSFFSKNSAGVNWRVKKWKFKMAFAMRGGEVSRASRYVEISF